MADVRIAATFSLITLATLASPSGAQSPPSVSERSSTGDLQYPRTRRAAVVDNYHGVSVADPYRWLEDLESGETRAWVDAQRALTDSILHALPDRDAIQMRLLELQARPADPTPVPIGGRLYLTRREEGKTRRVMYTTPDGRAAGVPLFDPNTLWLRGSEVFSNVSPAPDHRHVSYYVSPSGRDYGELRIRSVATGRDLADTLRGMRHPITAWLPDGRALLYTRNDPAADTGGADAASSGRQLVLHRIGTRQGEDRVLHEASQSGAWVRLFAASADGRFAVYTEQLGGAQRVLVADVARTRDDGPATVREVLGTGVHVPLGFVRHTLYVRTQDGAPNWRVVAIELTEQGGVPRTVVPEGTEPMADAALTSNRIVVQVMRDVQSRLLLHAHDGSAAGEVPLPGPGNVAWMVTDPTSPELFFTFTSTLTPRTLYRYDVASAQTNRIGAGPVALDVSGFETRQLFFSSKDGTRVPMFLTMRRGAPRDRTVPVMVYAYGGFGSTLRPSFHPYVMTWLEMGGAYALVNVRGGGEYGAAWHQAGIGKRKQTVFDDVIAAAEFLVREGYSASERLVLHGESNGGFTVAAVTTQRPDLFGVSLPLSGVHDLLRFHRFTVGRNWASETGTSDDPELFHYIRAYSPLHNVRPGSCYPATLVMAAADDDRVVPSHSYKFAAALQSAQACARPVLLHVARGVSHSGGGTEAETAQLAAMLAFAAERVGLRAPAGWRGAPRDVPRRF